MDWEKGYAASYRAVRVNPAHWKDEYAIEGIVSLSVDYDGSDSTPLLQSGSMVIDSDSFEAGWYRLEMVAEQGGDAECVPIATLRFEADSTGSDNGCKTVSCSGYSVLKPAATRFVKVGDFALAGSNCAEKARELIASCIPAPVNVEGGFALENSYVFQPSTSRLSAAWELLRAGGYCIQIDGDGTVNIRPLPTKPKLTIYGGGASVFMQKFTEEKPLDDIPNAYYVTRGEEYAEAFNDDPESPTSRVSRYQIDAGEENPQTLAGESLQAYAERKLREARTAAAKYGYQREFNPEVTLFDVISAPLAETMAQDDVRIVSGSLSFGNGVVVSEVAEKLEVL